MPCARVPVEAVQHDRVGRELAGEHRREQDAVVVRVRLGAEDGDLVAVRRDAQQLLERADARHAVADDDQPRSRHAASASRSAASDARPTTSPMTTVAGPANVAAAAGSASSVVTERLATGTDPDQGGGRPG